MAIKHGVYIYENDTSIRTPIEADGAIVVIGAAPVYLKENYTELINKPILCYSADEAIEKLGYTNNFAAYPLCQMMYLTKGAFPVSPVVYINVYDPTVSATSKTAELAVEGATVNQVKNLGEGVLYSANESAGNAIVLTQGETTLERDRDYIVELNSSSEVIVTALIGGESTVDIESGAQAISIAYKEAGYAGTTVTASDVVGAYNTTTGAATGAELIQQIYPKFGVTPTIIIAPGYSKLPEVGAALIAKAANLNGVFKGIALVDLDSSNSGAKTYTDTLAQKEAAGYTSPFCIPLWPCLKMSVSDRMRPNAVFAMSSVIACLMAYTDAQNRGVPSRSFSNKLLSITGAGVMGTCLESGAEVLLSQDQATHVNAGGVTTALNINGWRTWGSYTGAYPSINDVKDMWAPVRRMFNWQANTFILTYFSKVDDPLNYVLIESIVDSENIRCAAYAPDVWAGAEIEFLEADNPVTDLIAGRITFRQRIAPYTPAQEINNILSYDTSMLTEALFGAEQ